MFKGQIINQLLEERKAKKIDLYTYAKISRATLDNIISGKTYPNVKVLEPIADFFSVSLDIFFERSVAYQVGTNVKINVSRNKVFSDIYLNEHEKEIALLNKMLAEKERTIQILLNKGKDV